MLIPGNNYLKAQGIAINNSGINADTSSIFDVSSPNRGVLVPRIALTDTSDAVTIPLPAHSLIVFNTSTGGGLAEGYYYNEGTPLIPHWIEFQPNPANQEINMSGFKIINLATCTNDHDAANKAYVDALVAGGGGGSGNLPVMMSDESATSMNVMSASKYCNSLTEGGYNDWRLPDLYEFYYVVSTTVYTINNDASMNWAWLVEMEQANYSNRYLAIRMFDGYITYSYADGSYYVRCVR